MEIIIGRDALTRQLNVVKDGVAKKFGQSGSVPMDVSRQHISLTPAGTGRWLIKNLNAQNVTFVNGVAVESKTISEGEKVELGNSHYLFQWQAIQEPKVETVDIRPLQKVWDWYETTQLDMKDKVRETQNIQRFAGILSSCGLLFWFVEGLGYMRFVLMGLSVLISFYFFIEGFRSDSLDRKLNNLGKEFRRNYVCPKCHRFIGNTPYDVLVQNDACQYCKTKFKK